MRKYHWNLHSALLLAVLVVEHAIDATEVVVVDDPTTTDNPQKNAFEIRAKWVRGYV